MIFIESSDKDKLKLYSKHTQTQSKHTTNESFKHCHLVAKFHTHKLCNCPGSESGKVKIDINEHIPGCRFRKRSSQYATKTSVIPSKIIDGCSLGIALGEGYC
jgi:hypothetical protein